ncbi:MAG TPA: hypothetical protein VGG55_04005 [Candidatus Acidoferrales bacterium]
MKLVFAEEDGAHFDAHEYEGAEQGDPNDGLQPRAAVLAAPADITGDRMALDPGLKLSPDRDWDAVSSHPHDPQRGLG